MNMLLAFAKGEKLKAYSQKSIGTIFNKASKY